MVNHVRDLGRGSGDGVGVGDSPLAEYSFLMFQQMVQVEEGRD